jgi:c-di-GMP-binding flagellar brake protein YcgR
VSSPDITSRLGTTGQLLVRSEIEIGRILDSMLEDHDALMANLPSQLMFLSQLLYVEPVKGYILLANSNHKAANTAALALPKLTLRCSHRGSQFAFSGGAPHAVVHCGQSCIQCGMPTLMLAMQQRRAVNRAAVPAQAPVYCEVRMGPLTFDAKVIDVSLDGIGTLVSEPTIPLCAGTRLERARIRHAQHAPIEVDLEVRYLTRVKLPSGEQASRIGCRILSSPQDLEELIRLFIVDLQEAR